MWKDHGNNVNKKFKEGTIIENSSTVARGPRNCPQPDFLKKLKNIKIESLNKLSTYQHP